MLREQEKQPGHPVPNHEENHHEPLHAHRRRPPLVVGTRPCGNRRHSSHREHRRPADGRSGDARPDPSARASRHVGVRPHDRRPTGGQPGPRPMLPLPGPLERGTRRDPAAVPPRQLHEGCRRRRPCSTRRQHHDPRSTTRTRLEALACVKSRTCASYSRDTAHPRGAPSRRGLLGDCAEAADPLIRHGRSQTRSAVPHVLADEPRVGINGMLMEPRVRCRTARQKRWLAWSPLAWLQPPLQRSHRSAEHPYSFTRS